MQVARGRKRPRKRKTIQYFDYSLLAIVIFLVCFGLVMLYSTSSYSAQIENGDSMFYLKRQGLIS
ncbi:MAG: cell division protein, partial [Lachnospiraceae bacterium]